MDLAGLSKDACWNASWVQREGRSREGKLFLGERELKRRQMGEWLKYLDEY